MARVAWPDRHTPLTRLIRSCRALRARLALTLLLALLVVAGSAAGAGSPPPRVTVIGDSVAAGIHFTPDARDALAAGIDLNAQYAVCRRLTGDSCPYNGTRPPTLVDLASSLGSALGRTVIVAVGYNDYEQTYAENIRASLAALHASGVTRVLWVTLRAERQSYVSMNDDIRSVAAAHPEMVVVDWNQYSRSHPDWVQADGLHLTRDGAVALARLLHDTLVDLEIAAPARPALVVTSARLPVAHAGHRYAAWLRVTGGTAPYRWRMLSAALPRGLQLLPSGRISGTPVRPGRADLSLRVTDAEGTSTTRRVLLAVTG